MATSPLFGWEEPDDTDLVKDGAAAIRTLGNAIDTSMGDLLGGTTGQVLSKNSNTNMDFTWVTSDDANAIQNTIVDAKGDLISATGSDVPARLAVGTNDNFLQAASGESTGLKWAGAWTTYTPVLTGPTLGNGSISARYLKIGKMVTVEVRFALGSTSAIGADNFISLPFNAAQGAGLTIPVTLMDFGTTQFMGIGYLQYADTIRLLITNTTTSYGNAALVTSTVPFTWTTNDYIAFVITYEAA
jgi:hypothetical protein